MSSLIAFLQQILTWLLNALLWVPHKLYGLVLDGLQAFFHLIPVPDWLQNVGSYLSALPAGVAYFATSLQLPFGLTVIFGAYVLRFLIRRIPLIG